MISESDIFSPASSREGALSAGAVKGLVGDPANKVMRVTLIHVLGIHTNCQIIQLTLSRGIAAPQISFPGSPRLARGLRLHSRGRKGPPWRMAPTSPGEKLT